MSIPKRPTFEFRGYDTPDHRWIAHERAVAKRAVEALEEIEQRGWMYEMYADLLFGQFAKDVMDRVKASGWQP